MGKCDLYTAVRCDNCKEMLPAYHHHQVNELAWLRQRVGTLEAKLKKAGRDVTREILENEQLEAQLAEREKDGLLLDRADEAMKAGPCNSIEYSAYSESYTFFHTSRMEPAYLDLEMPTLRGILLVAIDAARGEED